MLDARTRSLRIHYFRAFSAVAATAAGRTGLKQLLAGELALDPGQPPRGPLVELDADQHLVLEGEGQRPDGTVDGLNRDHG